MTASFIDEMNIFPRICMYCHCVFTNRGGQCGYLCRAPSLYSVAGVWRLRHAFRGMGVHGHVGFWITFCTKGGILLQIVLREEYTQYMRMEMHSQAHDF